MTVWVLRIEHRHGFNMEAFTTEELATESLYEYVKEWWAKDGPKDAAVPEDRDEAIEAYFESNGESHDITEVEVQGEDNEEEED